MPTAYLALGSNLGDRGANLRGAISRLRAEPGLRVLAVSPFYETPPVGGPANQPAYLNAALSLETARPPLQLLRFLHDIEHQFGRVRTILDGPRTLDLDLLLYDDVILERSDVIVPHPRMHQRPFVLVPLAAIAPHVHHPRLNQSIHSLVNLLPAEEIASIERQPAEEPRGHQLAGLRALVTGSTAGIGAAIARAFEAEGATVLRHGRRSPAREGQLQADLADPAAVDRLAEEAWAWAEGRLDVVVCNAGADTLTGDAARWTFEEKLEALLAIDLKSTMRLGRDLGARMKARGRGAILTVGWDQAETGMEGDSGQLFAAVKGAVMNFTRSLALSLAPEVRVNCLAPGWIRTAWGETASELWQERVRRETPLRVWGLPEDVAAVAVWLASPAAQFQTGQIFRINGGAVR